MEIFDTRWFSMWKSSVFKEQGNVNEQSNISLSINFMIKLYNTSHLSENIAYVIQTKKR